MANSDQRSEKPSRDKRITVPKFSGMKGSGRKITMITAYDYTMARLVDEAGVEGVLVGDSMSMVVQGHENTLPVTLDEMIYHAEMVGRAVNHALMVVDMPFPSYHIGKNKAIKNAGRILSSRVTGRVFSCPCTTIDMPFPSYHIGRNKAIENAGRILKETRCQAVKLEGGADQADTIRALTSAGIPVMAHCGLCPQSVHQLGGYRVQRDEKALLEDASAATEAGAFALVLECVPSDVAQRITEKVAIPTIGIGAGPHCDGQVLVLHDVLGLACDYVPRFVKAYADLTTEVTRAVRSFRDEVRNGEFPGPEHGYK